MGHHARHLSKSTKGSIHSSSMKQRERELAMQANAVQSAAIATIDKQVDIVSARPSL